MDKTKPISTITLAIHARCNASHVWQSSRTGVGLWAVVARREGELQDHEQSDFIEDTSLPLTYLSAATAALERLPDGGSVVVVAVDDYLIKGMSERLAKWEARNWITGMGKPVEHQALWQLLKSAAARQASVTWTRPQGDEHERLLNLAKLASAKIGASNEPSNRTTMHG